MATRFGMAGGIPERRVRPIWDAVDSRQFKAALKLSAALLANTQGSYFERMGKPDEALSVCSNAMELLFSDNVVHIDDLTLSTLQIWICYILLRACLCKIPNNLEIMMGLFNCYVREYSYVKQQQTAIKMYKMVGEERFLLWAVLLSNGGEKLLSLAEALLKKHINSHSLHEPEALAIYISILEQQSKYEAALEVLSGNLGSLIGREEDKGGFLLVHVTMLLLLKSFRKSLNHGCLLEDNTNCFKASTASHTCLPSSVDSQVPKETHLSEELFDSRLSSALSVVEKLQKDGHDDCVRGPYLATIEIERRRHLNGNADDGKFLEALLIYFQRFNHLSCFASDVEMFLQMLTQDEKSELREKFLNILEALPTTPIKRIGQVITIFKVQELSGAMFMDSVKELEGTAIKMLEMFCENLPLSRDLDPQENMYGEELLSMASSVLVTLFWRTRNLGYLLEAVLVLEFGLIIRRYGTLEVKNILQETMSHHILPQMLKSPFCSEAADLVKEYLKFMDDHLREAADLTFLAYRHQRLQHSNQYMMARIESVFLQLKQKADSLEEIQAIFQSVNYGMKLLELSNEDKLTSLTFNEDLQTRPWWSPTTNKNFLSEPFEDGSACSRATMLSKKKTTEDEDTKKKEIERKSLIPRLLYLSMQAASSTVKENSEPNGTASDTNIAAELKILLERYARNIGLTLDGAISVILGIMEGQKSFKELSSDSISWMNFAVFVNALNLSSKKPLLPIEDKSNPTSWHIVDHLTKTCVMYHLSHAEPILTSPGNQLMVLVQLVTESFSWQILIIQSCMKSLLPIGKRKKKSGGGSGLMDQPNLPKLQAVQSSIRSLMDTIKEIQTRVADQINGSEDNDLDTLLSYVQRDDNGPGRIFRILEENVVANNPDLGERISDSLKSWSSGDVLRRVVRAQRKYLTEFNQICDSK
ncbi:N-alpha-acetyltransferase 25, NatB auxiliary subunit, partial [Ananas comosus]